MEDRLKASQTYVEQLTVQIEILNSQIQALLDSISWRISAPLRWCGAVLRWISILLLRSIKSFLLGLNSFKRLPFRLLGIIKRFTPLKLYSRSAENNRLSSSKNLVENTLFSEIAAETSSLPVSAVESLVETQAIVQNSTIVHEYSVSSDFHHASNKILMDMFSTKINEESTPGLIRAYAKGIDNASEH
jgi:hypothetical protein